MRIIKHNQSSYRKAIHYHFPVIPFTQDNWWSQRSAHFYHERILQCRNKSTRRYQKV